MSDRQLVWQLKFKMPTTLKNNSRNKEIRLKIFLCFIFENDFLAINLYLSAKKKDFWSSCY